MANTLKIGDKVKIRKLEENHDYKLWVTVEMRGMSNKVTTIKKVENIIGICYTLDDCGEWHWTEDMFDLIEEKEKKMEFKVGDKVKIKQLKEGYGYKRWVSDDMVALSGEIKTITRIDDSLHIVATNSPVIYGLDDGLGWSWTEDMFELVEESLIEEEEEENIARHKEICKGLSDTYEKKNHDYGNSFALLRGEYPQSILIRLFDKYNRLKTLMKGTSAKVEDESIRDTLIDMANYCILEIMEMDKEKK